MRILLVPDIPNWAWDFKANAIIKHLPQYEISKVYYGNFNANVINNYDVVFFFGWNEAIGKAKDISRISTGISSHNYYLLHKNRALSSLPKFKVISAVSSELYKMVKEINHRTFYAANGVEHDIFVPDYTKKNSNFIVGWVGQGTTSKIDIKCIKSFLEPLIKELREHKDIKIVVITNTHQNRKPWNEMVKFYQNIDCFITTSFREGTPNPAFQAASCGKAVISTKVGCIPELITHGVNGYIVDSFDNDKEVPKDRIKQMKKHILHLKNNRDLCFEMGKKNRIEIENHWTWEKRIKNWISVFEAGKK